MAKFVTIGERLSTTAPAVNRAFTSRDPEPILKRAKEQLDAGAVYLDVNIGPAESDGEDLMKWAVQLLQSEFDNVPLALDTSNTKAIEAGISVYNRSKGKPIVNSADAAGRIENIDLAAANDAIVIALCNGEGIAKDNDERMGYCQLLLERGLEHGMEAEDLWFDPLFLVVKGMQDKQMDILECINMEHTAKNLLIRAVRKTDRQGQCQEQVRRKVQDTTAFLHIEPTLQKLLGERHMQ